MKVIDPENIIAFQFRIIGERTEYKNIAPRSEENIFEAQIEITTVGRIDDKIRLRIDGGIPFSKEDYLRMVKKRDNSILHEKIEIIQIYNSNVQNISFKSSRLTNIKLSREIKEEYGETFIDLDSVRIIYGNKDVIEGKPESIFYLNDSTYKLLYLEYKFLFSKDKNRWEAISSISEIVYEKFTLNFDFEFDLEISHSADYGLIKKTPRLIIASKGGKVDIQKVEELADGICGVLALIRREIVDYGRVYHSYENQVEVIYKNNRNKGELDSAYFGLIPYGRRKDNVFNLLNEIACETLIEKGNRLKVNINRCLFTKLITGESKFMILYNILEQLKIDFGDTDKKTGFKFKLENKEVNKFILSKLESIEEIVDEVDKELFLTHIGNHVQTIKYRKMKDQIFGFVTKYWPEYPSENIDKFIDFRNIIFHGNTVENYPELEKAIIDLKNLILDITYKILLNFTKE